MTAAEIVELAPATAAGVEAHLPVPELPAFFARALPEAMAVAAEQGAAVTGPPFALYPSPPGTLVHVVAGIPVDRAVTPQGDVVPVELPGGPAIEGVHERAYDTIAATYERLLDAAHREGREPAGPMWEYYLTDPSRQPDPADWRTRVVVALRP